MIKHCENCNEEYNTLDSDAEEIESFCSEGCEDDYVIESDNFQRDCDSYGIPRGEGPGH